MKLIEFPGGRGEVDLDATRGWYAQAEPWGCECGHCRNFLALARDRKLPEEMLALLDGLGIPPEKSTYVCELYTDEAGMHYQINYRLAGRFLGDWKEGWCTCGHDSYPYGAPGFPEPHFDLMFWLTLPWVLDEPMDGE